MSNARPTDLRCEWRTEPLGIDALRPRLSWLRPGEQAGYQVQVATDREALLSDSPDRWDSGRVESDA